MNKVIVGAAVMAAMNIAALGIILSQSGAGPAVDLAGSARVDAGETVSSCGPNAPSNPPRLATASDRTGKITGAIVAGQPSSQGAHPSYMASDAPLVDATDPIAQPAAHFAWTGDDITQAYLDRDNNQAIVRIGIQKNDCGCCNELQRQLQANGYKAEFSHSRPTNDIEIFEHVDRCRMITLDGVPMSGYDAFELGRIIDAKFNGQLPERLAHTRNQDPGVDPRLAKGYRGERSLIVVRDTSN